MPHASTDQPGRDVTAVVVGSGFGGIAMAAQFARDAMTDYVIVERGDDVGGTWRDNTYPGAACDVPSHLYSFSFAPNPDWTRSFSPQADIQCYLQSVARSVGVYDHCRFRAEVISARWDHATQRWTVRTTRGDFRARFLISAAGLLSDPAIPALPGIERFAGRTFHSARWDHAHDLTGERVAVIGTGASAIQFIPRIADRTARLLVFQRTAPWVIARHDRAFRPVERWVYRHVSGVQRLARTAIYWARESYVVGFAKVPWLVRLPQWMARRHLRAQVADVELRRRLTPTFAFGCKRVLISNEYYPTLGRDDVELVTESIREVRAHSIVTADGQEHDVDTIVYATGFRTSDMPIAERIVDGEGTSLAERWRGGKSALYGSTVAGFPNFFMIIGPNTGLAHTSMVVMIEANAGYVADAIRQIDARGLSSVQPRASVQTGYNAVIQGKLMPSVWNTGGCRSWYLDARGNNTTLWPDFTFRFRHQSRRVNLAEYEVVRGR